MLFNRSTGLIIGITLILLLGLGTLATFLIKEGIHLQSEIKNQEQELDAIEKERINLAVLAKNQSEIRSLYEKAAAALPVKEDSTAFIGQWEQLEQASHLTEEGFSLSRSAGSIKKDGVEELKFSAKLQGVMTDFISFLTSLEQGQRLVSWQDLTYTSAEANSKLEINGLIYYKTKLSLNLEDQTNWQLDSRAKERFK